jgi:hypothetical protein
LYTNLIYDINLVSSSIEHSRDPATCILVNQS